MEIYDRELKGMLLFSILATSLGWKVFLGSKASIFSRLNFLPEGFVLLKSIVPGEVNIQKSIIESGHKVITLDAEGLLPSNGESGVLLRFSNESICHTEKVFLWGNEQYDQLMSIFSEHSSKFEVTGSPYMDVWNLNKRKGYATTQSRNKIVIASSFPYPNHFVSNKSAIQAVYSASDNNSSNEYFDEIFLDEKLQSFVFPQFKNLVLYLVDSLPEYNFILRPHPSENSEVWREILNGYKNVTLNETGSISTLLLETDYLIHFNSTTSIEATLYNKNVLTYLPNSIPKDLSSRLNKYALMCSTTFTHKETMLDFIVTGQITKKDTSEFNSIMHQYDDTGIGQSSKNILHSISSLDLPVVTRVERSSFFIDFNILFFKKLLSYSIGFLDYKFKLFFGRYSDRYKGYLYGKKKQPDISLSFIKELAGDFYHPLGLNPKDIHISSYAKNLFIFSKKLLK